MRESELSHRLHNSPPFPPQLNNWPRTPNPFSRNHHSRNSRYFHVKPNLDKVQFQKPMDLVSTSRGLSQGDFRTPFSVSNPASPNNCRVSLFWWTRYFLTQQVWRALKTRQTTFTFTADPVSRKISQTHGKSPPLICRSFIFSSRFRQLASPSSHSGDLTRDLHLKSPQRGWVEILQHAHWRIRVTDHTVCLDICLDGPPCPYPLNPWG